MTYIDVSFANNCGKDAFMTILPTFFKEKSATLASSSLLLVTLTATGCQSASESSEAIVSQPTSSY